MMAKPIALIEAASFCDEVRRAKDTAESRFPAPKKEKAQTDLSFHFISFWPLSF
jgi:hypothetical protein